jgi:hypothetical protein
MKMSACLILTSRIRHHFATEIMDMIAAIEDKRMLPLTKTMLQSIICNTSNTNYTKRTEEKYLG